MFIVRGALNRGSLKIPMIHGLPDSVRTNTCLVCFDISGLVAWETRKAVGDPASQDIILIHYMIL